MGSAFVKKPGIGIVDGVGKTIETPFYIQFVPGYVKNVITSRESIKAAGTVTMNAIQAVPHITSDDEMVKSPASIGDGDMYVPLLRGITDVPAKGDPVLLCTIGKRKYYLGPMNVFNSPNWNEDNLKQPNASIPEHLISSDLSGEELYNWALEQRGQSVNFQKTNNARLIKPYNTELDGIIENGQMDYNEIHGDLLFEGRHGNSIRIGSRYSYPHIFISNARMPSHEYETTADGSIIALINNGSIKQHFYNHLTEGIQVPSDKPGEEKNEIEFRLASDSISLEPNAYKIENMVKNINLLDNANPYLYEYGTPPPETNGQEAPEKSNQILINSERIVFNAKNDDIFISAYNDIFMGAGKNLILSSKESTIINSKNIYLGSPVLDGSSREMEPMVLGTKLFEVLEKLVATLSDAHFYSLFAGGPPSKMPIMDNTGTAPLSIKLKEVGNMLEAIKSIHHYIEPNEGKK